MADSNFQIEGLVGTYDENFPGKDPLHHYSVSLDTFGFKKDEEIGINHPVPDGGLIKIKTLFEKIKRPTPFTFSWRPFARAGLFQNFKKQKNLQFEVTFGRWDGKGKIDARWVMTLDGVHILKIYPDKIAFSDNTQKNERIEAYFSEFSWSDK